MGQILRPVQVLGLQDRSGPDPGTKTRPSAISGLMYYAEYVKAGYFPQSIVNGAIGVIGANARSRADLRARDCGSAVGT